MLPFGLIKGALAVFGGYHVIKKADEWLNGDPVPFEEPVQYRQPIYVEREPEAPSFDIMIYKEHGTSAQDAFNKVKQTLQHNSIVELHLKPVNGKMAMRIESENANGHFAVNDRTVGVFLNLSTMAKFAKGSIKNQIMDYLNKLFP